MKEFVVSSIYFFVVLTVLGYLLGGWLFKKTKFFLFSPLIVSTTICICFICWFDIPYKEYEKGANIISYMLTPATVCLAIPLYKEFEKLKENVAAILTGIISGVLVNMFCVYFMCLLFKITHIEYISLLPKSITTPISFALTSQYGGELSITAMMVIIAGNLGNLFASQLCSLFGIKDPVAKGVAIGTSSHALGTSRAIELGQTEGAMSGLSVAVTGLITVCVIPFFVNLI